MMFKLFEIIFRQIDTMSFPRKYDTAYFLSTMLVGQREKTNNSALTSYINISTFNVCITKKLINLLVS